MSEAILPTKLHLPSKRSNFVLRDRLVECLQVGQHPDKHLTLVSAKAGSGKTTLVSQWVHEQSRPTAWLSLDGHDNEAVRFVKYFFTALEQAGLKVSPGVQKQIESFQPDRLDNLLTELISDLDADTQPFNFVLDDYHLIENDGIHQALEFLIDHQPTNMHLICITRIDPPLPLARLRARGQICEIRDSDLQFSVDEAVTFCNTVMDLRLSVDDISILKNRTEGWVAGLQLAAISLKGLEQQGDTAAFLNAFKGTNRFVLDYLIEDVLRQQPPAIQDFLMETAILDRMCGSLCDAVRSKSAQQHTKDNDDFSQQQSGQEVLEELERKNLFIVPLDDKRYWYRYHHLFADLLKSTQQQKFTKEQIRLLHLRASHWHQVEGTVEEAMHHAIAAEDFEAAAKMIDENIANMFSHSEVPVLLRWIDKLPADVLRRFPWVEIHRANTLAISGQPESVASILDSVESRIETDAPRRTELLGHIASIRAYAANLQGNPTESIEKAQLATKLLPEDHPTGLGMAAYTLADTYLACDQMDEASQALLEMVEVGERTNQLMILVLALCELAKVRMIQGHLNQAKVLLDKAYKSLADQNSLEFRLRCSYEFGMADLLREWDRLDEAYEHAQIGDELRKRFGGYLMVGDLAIMGVLQARGDSLGAMDVLHTAEQIMEIHQIQLSVINDFKARRVLQWLAVGDLESASKWTENGSSGSEQEQIVSAQVYLAQGKFNGALKLIDSLIEAAEAGGRIGRLIKLLALKAIALKETDQIDPALEFLTRALSLARMEGYVRTFLDLGRPLYGLLTQFVSWQKVAGKPDTEIDRLITDYAGKLIQAFEQQGIKGLEVDQPLISPLTERELEVLNLLAEGLTNQAIAERLIVAPSTIKQHLKNIYGKLDVHNRTQAVARGRDLGLLQSQN